MAGKQKFHQVKESIRVAKSRREMLPEIFSGRDRMFLLFVQYFLDQLDQEFTVRMIVWKFLEVTAHLYCPRTFSLYPKLVPAELVLLRYQRKMKFFFRFPEIAHSLFPGEVGKLLTQEFDQQNIAYESFRIAARKKSLRVKS